MSKPMSVRVNSTEGYRLSMEKKSLDHPGYMWQAFSGEAIRNMLWTQCYTRQHEICH